MAARRKIYAALDLGTNNCRLSIAVQTGFNPLRYKIISRYSNQIRLGEKLQQAKMLQRPAMNRALLALNECRILLTKYNIYKARYIATEACRVAENSAYFLGQVYEKTALHFEIIDREEEAQLAILACSDIIEKLKKPVLLFDIGGGSSQLCFINSASQLYKPIIIGLDIGVVNMWECFKSIKNNLERFKAIKNHVLLYLQNTGALSLVQARQNFHLLGISGTATTLAALYLELGFYDRKKINGICMKSSDIKTIIDKIIETDIRTLAKNPCIGPARADLILAGCAILSVIMELWPSEKLQAIDRGLREGIFRKLMQT